MTLKVQVGFLFAFLLNKKQSNRFMRVKPKSISRIPAYSGPVWGKAPGRVVPLGSLDLLFQGPVSLCGQNILYFGREVTSSLVKRKGGNSWCVNEDGTKSLWVNLALMCDGSEF